MRPTYEQLVELNPLLHKKTPEEVESLIDSIIETGYEWRDDKKIFYNAEYQVSVRTQGLDLFTAESFKELQKTTLNHEHVKKNQELLGSIKNSAKILFVLLILTIASFIWWSWKLGLFFILLMVLHGYTSEKKRNRIRAKL